MKKIISLFIIFGFVFYNLSFAGEAKQNGNSNRNQALTYFAQMSFIELWSSKTSQEFMNKVEREGLSSDFFFAGAGTIQEKTLAMLQALPVPDVAELKEYHNKRIDAVKVGIEGFNAGLNKDMAEFERFQTKSAEMLQKTDELAERIKSEYFIKNSEIQELVDPKKIDVKWMEPIIMGQ